MNLFRTFKKLEDEVEQAVDLHTKEGRVVLRNIGWVSAGITILAIGVVVGRELRGRYKFNRRTPYDYYAKSSDERNDVEFGVGV
jgi:hypothetical protein